MDEKDEISLENSQQNIGKSELSLENSRRSTTRSKIRGLETTGVAKMRQNIAKISFQANFRRKAPKSQEICRNSFALLLHNTVQGWRSGESSPLPPMWLRFDSQTRHHKWAEFHSTLPQEVFLQVLRFSPLLNNQHFICVELS